MTPQQKKPATAATHLIGMIRDIYSVSDLLRECTANVRFFVCAQPEEVLACVKLWHVIL
jgi:hypothetical protein